MIKDKQGKKGECVEEGEDGASAPANRDMRLIAWFERFRESHPSCARVELAHFEAMLRSCPGADVEEAVDAFCRHVGGAEPIKFPLREFEKYLRRSVERRSPDQSSDDRPRRLADAPDFNPQASS